MAKKEIVRRGQRGVVNKRLGEVDASLADVESGGEPDQAKLARLKLALEEKMAVLKRLDEEIIALTQDEEAVITAIEEADDYCQSVYERLVKLDSCLTQHGGSMRSSQAKLPKLNLPTFNGDMTMWNAFWDFYEVAVHKNTQLSDIQRFTYLRSLVKGMAQDTISGLALTAANYAEAITLLKERFGNKERIIAKHMEALLSLNTVTRQSDTKALRALYDKVETNVRELRALGVDDQAYNLLLPSVVMKCLPCELRLSVSRKLPESEWKLDKIMKELNEELKARERAASENKHQEDEQRRRRNMGPGTSASLFTGQACCYCSQAHSSDTCQKVISVEARKLILRQSNRCFTCLRKGHISRNCRRNIRCSHCNDWHHVSICSKKGSLDKTKDNSPKPFTEKSLDPRAEPFKSASLFTDNCSSILLQTATATCFNLDNSSVRGNLRLAFDSGSQRSYITERVSDKLALSPVGSSTMRITAFGSSKGKGQTCRIVKIGVETKEGSHRTMVLLTVPVICEPLTGTSLERSIESYQHLQGLELADSFNDRELIDIDILVGLDNYWDFISGEVIRANSGPTAVYSCLGWLLSGPALQESTSLMTHVLTVGMSQGRDKVALNQQLKKFWELEAFGVSEKEEDSLYSQFQSNVSFNGERYEVNLPWRDMELVLPDNYQLSFKRLNGLLRRLRQQPKLLEEYNRAIKEQVERGIVEVLEDPTAVDGERVHYLPHHAVIRHDKETTKLRVVYDASAKTVGASLNESLHSGPKFNQHIFEILLRFRVNRCAFIADIEKAFLMIAVARQDRDVLRFLWVKDINVYPPEIVVMRFTRVTFGVTASPFLLNATVKHHIEQYKSNQPLAVNKLLRSIYVDDVVSGADSREEAECQYEDFRLMLASGGFNLRKFVCNNESLNPNGRLGEHKVLGVSWNVDSDCLMLNLREIVSEVDEPNITKRKIVSIASKIFDPIGIAAPITIQAKLLFQKLHCAKLGWDAVVEGDLLKEWLSLLSILRESEPICIPRWYQRNLSIDEHVKWTLHGFSDASTHAYAAVVYLQSWSGDERKSVFVASKSRVAPVSEQTVPRLELLGALLLARLIKNVYTALESEIQVSTTSCYTDSQVALYWIRGEDKDWKPFIQNRVKEIRSLVPANCWSHCKGKDNPADIPTRGLTTKELTRSNLWFYGPSWLSEAVVQEELPGEEIPEDCISELRVADRRALSLLVNENRLAEIIDLKKYSRLDRLCRVTGLVLKFIHLLKAVRRRYSACSTQSDERREREAHAPCEHYAHTILMQRSEQLWIIECQKSIIQDEKFQIWQKQFQLFQDTEGIWRCGGRLKNASLPSDTKHPVLLPMKHYFTGLIIQRAHERVYHNGVKETLTEVRSKYWILKGRAAVKQYIHHCIICRKAEGRSYSGPIPPPLPKIRVTEEPPFTYTGVDFAGPLYVKNGTESESKVWLCLFTCCVTRAIHLDIVCSLSVEFFLRSFRRFIARRGLPRRIVSDNAKTFKSTAKIIKRLMNHPDIDRYLADHRISWTFNLERAPWWGGVFERLIRSVKRCLKKIIGRAKLTHEELLTIVTEVEMIVNSRPLSYVSQEDLDEPITPSHLLIGKRVLSLPDSLCYEDDEEYTVTPQIISKRLKHLNQMMDKFWRRWRNEYLLELRDAHRYYSPEGKGAKVAIGDMVVVHSDSKKRGFWNLGRIEELINGQDGFTRGAVVRVYTGQKKSKLLKRSVKHLYPLEVTIKEDSASGLNAHSNDVDSPVVSQEADSYVSGDSGPQRDALSVIDPPRKSKRSAAINARDRIYAHSID